MTKYLLKIATTSLALVAFGAIASETHIKWLGHGSVQITTPKGHVLLIDPWFGNPAVKKAAQPITAPDRIDYILITHGHRDHVADASKLAQKSGARLLSNPELGFQLAKLNGYPKDQMGLDTLFNIGGTIGIAGDEVEVKMVFARHSSGMNNPFSNDDPKAPASVYAGNPGGFVVKIKDGPTVYLSGDTDYYSDMKLIAESYNVDLAMVSAGDHFTMGPADAARSAKAVGAKLGVPIHWGTFPILAQSMKPFERKAAELGLSARIIDVGTTLTYRGNTLK